MALAKQINDWVFTWLIHWGASKQTAASLTMLLLLVTAIVLVFLLTVLSKKIGTLVFTKIANRTRSTFDNHLLHNKAILYLTRVVPFTFMFLSIPVIFHRFPEYISPARQLFDIYLVIWVVRLVRAVLLGLKDYLKERPEYKDKPVDSFIQIFIIITYLVAAVFLFSVITGKSIGAFLTAMGAISAVILLIFRDTILGFVASIQVATNDMVRIGDWITMEKYGADGDVVEINLTTVKVQNFDKTITTIPTYYLISDSFKNWRGMQESGGRRIKRSVRVKVSSIKYLSHDDIARLKKIQLIAPYLETKGNELDLHNQRIGANKDLLINGLNFTNIGVYRQYINNYIAYNENLHKGMTMVVRQLEPTATGIPVELYVFTADIRWENYEHIMADLFDHILAAIPYFDLEVFEMPNSGDVRALSAGGESFSPYKLN